MFVHKSVVLLLAIVGRLSARRHGAFAFGPRSVGSTLTGTLRTSPPDKKQLVLRPTRWTEWPSPVDKATGSMAVRAMAAETAVAAAEAASSVGRSIDWAPLVLSLMAGLSTCIGASVVFLAQWRRRRGVATVTAATAATDGSATTTTSLKGKDLAAPIISHAHLCFSIAFAGSVMVTVSLFSLLPESFSSDESSAASTSSFLLSPSTRDFWYRVASFLAGGGLCLLLSKAAFPEPEDVLDDLYSPENADVEEEIVPLIQERKIPAGQPSRQLSIVKRQASTLVGADKAHRPPPTTLLVATRTANSTTADVESNPIDAVGAASSAARSGPERPRGATSSSSGGGGWWWSRFASGSDLTTTEAKRSWRVALLLFASLLAHNFPEGFAVAASSMHSPKLGVTTAVAIAFHNIPEGIAIAVPCLAARPDSPWLAFGLASLSGLAEPVGAFVAIVVLHGFDLHNNGDPNSASSIPMDIDSILSFVAGVMVTVACYELFPEARRHTQDGTGPFWLGIVAGAIIMLASDAVLDATY